MVRTKSNHVYLDLTHLDGNFIKNRFPRIYATCLQYDVDITTELVPVSPAAHYMMGGIKTDLDGATSIGGLFAAGEVTCSGVHGANRLASNSLLEGLVFGARAGRAAARHGLQIAGGRMKTWVSDIGKGTTAPSSPHGTKRLRTPNFDMEETRHLLRKLMWERVGIIRCGESLNEAKSRLGEWSSILDRSFTTRRELELRNMLELSKLITEAAISRKGSVGAHYRSDYPERGEGWERHITFRKGKKRLKYELVS